MFPVEKRIAIPYKMDFVIVLTLILDEWKCKSIYPDSSTKTEIKVTEIWRCVILERSIVQRLWRGFTVFYERCMGDGLFAGAAAELMEKPVFFDSAEEAVDYAKRQIDECLLDSEGYD